MDACLFSCFHDRSCLNRHVHTFACNQTVAHVAPTLKSSSNAPEQLRDIACARIKPDHAISMIRTVFWLDQFPRWFFFLARVVLMTSRGIVGRSLEVLSVANFQNLAESALKSASPALKMEL